MLVTDTGIFRVGVAPTCEVVVNQEDGAIAGAVFSFNENNKTRGTKTVDVGFKDLVETYHNLKFVGRVVNG